MAALFTKVGLGKASEELKRSNKGLNGDEVATENFQRKWRLDLYYRQLHQY